MPNLLDKIEQSSKKNEQKTIFLGLRQQTGNIKVSWRSVIVDTKKYFQM